MLRELQNREAEVVPGRRPEQLFPASSSGRGPAHRSSFLPARSRRFPSASPPRRSPSPTAIVDVVYASQPTQISTVHAICRVASIYCRCCCFVHESSVCVCGSRVLDYLSQCSLAEATTDNQQTNC
uniref:Uncharacterized protein n=1 Tax=Plectus sambesii TaxID=2011161 RepID=A0A914VIM1_9BILA